MKFEVIYFKVVAIIYILSGILGLFFADQYISLLDADASTGGRLWARAFGAVSVGFGVMYWMMNPSKDQRARKIGAVGAALTFGLTGLTDLISVLTGDLPPVGWGFIAFHVVMVGLAINLLFRPDSSLSVQT